MSSRSDITTETKTKMSKLNVKDKIELSELIVMTLSGDQDASNRLYDKCFETIKAVFLPKICKTDWEGIPIPDGIEDLCIETFKKAVQSLSDAQLDIYNPSFDLFKHFENTANKYWNDLVQKANQGNKEVIGRFYMLCKKQLMGYFKRELGAYSHYAEDFCQFSFEYTIEKILEKPYDPAYSVYSYFKYLVYGKYVNVRSKNGEIKFSGGNIYRRSREIPSSEILNIDKNKDEIRETDVIDRVSDDSNPEKLLLAKEAIKLRIIELKHEYKEKLTLLQHCAQQTKPHKFLAFGFNTLLKWKTRDVAEKCSDISFEALSSELFETICYDMKWFMNKKVLYTYFSPLFEKLDKETSLIYPEEKVYLVKLKDYLNKKSKVLFFSLFYTGSPTVNISDWSYRVNEICRIDFGLD